MRIGSRVKPHKLVLTLASVLVGTAAQGQLMSERTDGRDRVCLYRAPAAIINDGLGAREYRVGLAQNCPLLPPGAGPAPMPPTARLTEEAVSGTIRSCIYEEAGRRWEAVIPVAQNCPLAAGMLPRASAGRP